jgi:hypothetical protein
MDENRMNESAIFCHIFVAVEPFRRFMLKEMREDYPKRRKLIRISLEKQPQLSVRHSLFSQKSGELISAYNCSHVLLQHFEIAHHLLEKVRCQNHCDL